MARRADRAREDLFASVTSEGRWVPWLLFAAFGLVATVALLLVARVVRGAAQLHVSQERYALAVEGANDGIWDRDFVTGATYFSPRRCSDTSPVRWAKIPTSGWPGCTLTMWGVSSPRNSCAVARCTTR